MENNNVKGCVINRQWVEKAQALISDPSARCEFYEYLFSVSFGWEKKVLADPTAYVMAQMCEDYVLEDARKYETKCEQNRLNALKRSKGATESDRMRPLATASKPSEPKPIAANNNTNTNTNTNNKTNLSTETIGRDREEFDLLGIFFAKDVRDYRAEYSKFLGYYESTGWRNKNGQPIVNKCAAARMWKCTGECARSIGDKTLWFTAFKTSQAAETAIWDDFIRLDVEPDGLLVVTMAKTETVNLIEERCVAQLRALLRQANCKNLTYRVRQAS